MISPQLFRRRKPIATQPEAVASPHPAPLRGCGPIEMVVMAAWFGLVASLVEIAVLLARHYAGDASLLGVLQLNRHFLWMVPLSLVVVFSACGVLLAPLAMFRRAMAAQVGVFLFAALTSFGILLLFRGMYVPASAVLAAGIASVFARLAKPRMAGFLRIVKLSLPALLAIVAGLGAWSYDANELSEPRQLAALPIADPASPNVLLIVLDTVRADHLSAYGYHRDTTPNLKRLAASGVAFEQARSTAPWTLPSHSSMFTGKWVHELKVDAMHPLDSRFPTLAEHLASRGYATAGFVGNTYYCNSWYGLARGFAHYEDYYEQNVIISPSEALRCSALGRLLITTLGNAYNVRPGTANSPKDAERVNRDFLLWLDKHQDHPYFAFLNYFDAHDPYTTPTDFNRHFGLKPETPDDFALIQGWHAKDKKTVTPREHTLICDAYDDCLSYLDEQVGRLLDDLELRGTLKNTLVIVTSDHGEELGDHKLYGHAVSLYRPELHVPLILAGFGVSPKGRSIAEPVTLRDLAITVSDLVGPRAKPPFPGRSLGRFWKAQPPDRPSEDSAIFSEVALFTTPLKERHPEKPPAFCGPMVTLVAMGKSYIRNAYGDEELYDLAADPAESRNLAPMPENGDILRHCRDVIRQLVPEKNVSK